MTNKKCSSCKHDQPMDLFERKWYEGKKARQSYILRICDMCNSPENYGEKYCSMCGDLKPLTEFFKRKDSPNRKYKAACRVCECNYGKRYRANKLYGLTLDDIQRIKSDQGAACSICEEITQLVVDHNHATGEVRALLCDLCNRGLGYFKDSPEILLKASNYLLEKGYSE